MFRVLTAFLLLLFEGPASFAQINRTIPVFKTGSLSLSNSLLHLKTSGAAWQRTEFGKKFYVVVQLDHILTGEERAILEPRGIQLNKYISQNHYLAVCRDNISLSRTSDFGIRNIYALPPALKSDPAIFSDPSLQQGPKNLIAVTCFSADPQVTKEVLIAAGAQLVETKIKPSQVWFLHASPAVLKKLALLPFVVSMRPIHLEDFPLNYNNRAIHAVHALSATAGRNLTGKNLILGIGDNADPSSHIDLNGKLIMRTDEPVSAHGTHTSGTLAGGGFLNPKYAGMAPRAHLVVNDFSNIIVNSPTYVQDYQMPLTNNSYFNGLNGCPGEGDYNELSNYADSQLLAYPKLLHVFASGNDGALTCAPFPGSFATIKSGFQTAKNILAVGSISNVNYTISPFSSCGPVKDGRLKPEVVAGGAGIISTFPGNTYGSDNGTSMASPTVTGILALITERYKQLQGGQYPDAALLKALISNSADDLGNTGPDFQYGFGMVNARTTVEALEKHQYIQGLITNQGSQQFTIPSLPAGVYQLKIMLYWPDVPALPFAAGTLVNDLDLTVTDPGSALHRPMVLDSSAANVNNPAAEGADHINNIEQVLIKNPVAGNYTVRVNGFSVPAGPQPFYIVYEIITPSVTVEYPFGNENWVPGETETIRWSAYGGDPNPFTVEYSLDQGTTWNLISNSVPSASRSLPWTVPFSFSNQALIRVTRNGAGYNDASDYPFTILGQPQLTVTNTCPGYALLNWNAITGADQYQIQKLSGDSMQVIAQTTDTSFLITPLNKDSSYWFSVNATLGGYAGRRAIAQNIIPGGGACTFPGLNNDLILDSIVAPVSGRQFSSSQPGVEQIVLRVRNPGSLPTGSAIRYSYQVNEGPVVTEISPVVLSAGSNSLYTFSIGDSYDFSNAGTYQIKAWIHYAADTIPQNDTLTSTIRTLKNDPLILNPTFTEGFETALDQAYTLPRQGLDSLDRADFTVSGSNARLNTFFNSGFARTGKRSILLDVTEQGTNAADSLINTFNLSNYTATDQIWLDLYFRKQSAVPALPGNAIFIRGSDQSPWIPVKSLSDPADLAGSYIKFNLDISGTLASAVPAQTLSSSFQIKCGAEGRTPAASINPQGLPGGGISFDDFMITRSQNDLAMRAILSPALKNICGLSNEEKITVIIRNYGTDTLKNIPVSYAINTDTITEIIPFINPKDSVQYIFNQTADMSVYQAYHLKTWVSNASDNYRNNDSSADILIQTTPLINQFPYLEGFENNNGYWYTNGQNDSWQWGKPMKSIIHKAANGTNVWVTHLNGNYNDNEYSFLYSPCFDLSGLNKPVLSFSHIFQTEDDCNCDFHWVEYTLDDSSWTILGNATSGVNWYDNAVVPAWQLSDTNWHVSSYDIPVTPSKIRFRIVMYSDPGTNYEGVAIDDVHIFEKASISTDSLIAQISQPVSGSGWTDFDLNGKRLFSINPNGQNLGITKLIVYRDTSMIRDTAGQYYGGRNWVLQTTMPASSAVNTRYYFTDSEANKLIHANSCASCLNIEDAYSCGITQYSSQKISEEDSSLMNNRSGIYQFHKPQKDVQIIPFDNGYYAETQMDGFSEFWLNGGGIGQDHPLAAWLKDFTAVAAGSSGLLNWDSWQEVGSLRYSVEKSTDSANFRKIGQVAAIPHQDSLQNYRFTDPSLLDGNNYYRLVLYFQNGDSLISPVQKLYYNPIPAYLQVYPNPTEGEITIKTPVSCREIQIFDLLGRKLLEQPASGYTQQVSIASFSRGVYFLKLFTDSGNKLIKLKRDRQKCA